MGRTVTVLSLDGGGIRGLGVALIVRDIVRRINLIDGWRHRRYLPPLRSSVRSRTRRGRPATVPDLFDIVAGTSSGALVGLGLVQPRPYTPLEIVTFYRTHGVDIFPPSRFAALRTVRQAFGEKYEDLPFEGLLHDLYGDKRLSECLTNVLVAAYDTDHRGPFFFKHFTRQAVKRNPRLGTPERVPPDFYLRDVARATTAASTYFSPSLVLDGAGNRYTLIDGGMVANNPALTAWVEAKRIYPNTNRVIIASIGTGRTNRTFSHETIRKWGYLDWVSPAHGVPIATMMQDGQNSTVAHTLKRVPGVEYFRFDADLGDVNEDMDDARPANLAAIERWAARVIRFHNDELHRLARLIFKLRLG